MSLTVNEEADDASSTPGRAAVLTVMTIVSVYMFVTIGSMMFAGLGKDGIGPVSYTHLTLPTTPYV